MKWSKIKASIEEQIAANGWSDPDIEWLDWSEGSSMGNAPELGGIEDIASIS